MTAPTQDGAAPAPAPRPAADSDDGLDPVQRALLDSEHIIAVDKDDTALGPVSKREGHLAATIRAGRAHRVRGDGRRVRAALFGGKMGADAKTQFHSPKAFSLFLFDRSGERLLMQKRSAAKVTFARRWSNTCCSHPWWVGEADGVAGCRRAVVRKVEQELGITTLREDDLRFIERASRAPRAGRCACPCADCRGVFAGCEFVLCGGLGARCCSARGGVAW